MDLTAPLIKLYTMTVEVETDKGTAIATTPIQENIYDLVTNQEMPAIQRPGSGKLPGNSMPAVIGSPRVGKATFTMEFRGTQGAAMNTALVACLQACGCEQSLQVYTPTGVHATQETVTLTFYENGLKKILAGCMGEAEIYNNAEDGRILVDFDFTGRWTVPTDAGFPTIANSTANPFIWGTPPGAFTFGGESIKISTFRFKLGNEVAVYPDAGNYGIAYGKIVNRNPTLTIDPDMDLVENYDYYGLWLAGTIHIVSLILADGTDKATLAIPRLQITDIAESDRDNVMTLDLTGQCNFNEIDTGDDDWSLTIADDGVA